MTNYLTQVGDTLEDVSRSRFGTEGAADLIRKANPGVPSTLAEGLSLIIPEILPIRSPLNADNEQLSVAIGGQFFEGWTEVAFTRSMDSFGSFDLLTAWDPDNAAFRELFRPFSYQRVTIFEGDTLLYTGTMLSPTPEQTAGSRIVRVTGYSLPGVLNDCTAPIGALPLERNDMNMRQIADELLTPFGLAVQFDTDAGPAFEREAMKPTQTVLRYLVGLAQQRQLLITDTPDGACLFQTETPAGRPVAVLADGDPGVDRIAPNFRPQQYYSHVTGQSPTAFAVPKADPGGQFTAPNRRLPDVLRPLTFQPADTNVGDAKTAAEAKIGRMFANAVAYSAVVPDWVTPGGELWEPNTTMKLHAPGAMIYDPFEFLIRSVSYHRTRSAKVATLDLVLPGSFRGEVPVLPLSSK